MARFYKLKTTVHLAEVPDHASDWLEFFNHHIPDRIGHGTFLNLDQDDADIRKVKQIVSELHIPLGMFLLLIRIGKVF